MRSAGPTLKLVTSVQKKLTKILLDGGAAIIIGRLVN
jgi:hypothetical protein